MLADLQGPEARAGCKAAQQALQRVHEQAAGKVHGDTRVANTMVNLRDGNCSVRFIDFEVCMCGSKGEVRRGTLTGL